eukprot:6625553-Prymnesium_polylepis.1
MATPTSPSAAAPNEASHMPPTLINPNNTSSRIPGLCGESGSPLGGRAWFGGASPSTMWAGFEEGPA